MFFGHKIGSNSTNTRDSAKKVAPNRGFSRSSNLRVALKYTSDDPCCHGNENLGISAQN